MRNSNAKSFLYVSNSNINSSPCTQPEWISGFRTWCRNCKHLTIQGVTSKLVPNGQHWEEGAYGQCQSTLFDKVTSIWFLVQSEVNFIKVVCIKQVADTSSRTKRTNKSSFIHNLILGKKLKRAITLGI